MIFVFKTSVSSKKMVKRLTPLLYNSFPDAKFSFDIDDCDNVLRIESDLDVSERVINQLKVVGFDCEELK